MNFSSPILAQMLRPTTFVRDLHSFCVDTNLADHVICQRFSSPVQDLFNFFISDSSTNVVAHNICARIPFLLRVMQDLNEFFISYSPKISCGSGDLRENAIVALMKNCISLVYLGGQDNNGERLNFHFPNLYKCYTP